MSKVPKVSDFETETFQLTIEKIENLQSSIDNIQFLIYIPYMQNIRNFSFINLIYIGIIKSSSFIKN